MITIYSPTMATRLCLGFCLIIALAKTECSRGSRLRRIEERLGVLHDRFDRLQDRFDGESKFRRDEMRNLFKKIESNSAGLNLSAIDVQCRKPTETSDMSVDWRRDLKQLSIAFKDVKLLNTAIREQFPNVVDRIQTAEESIGRVDQIVQGVSDDIREVATDVRMVLDNINTNQIKLNNIVHEMNKHKNASLDVREASPSKNDGSISNMEYSGSNSIHPKSCVEIYERGNHVSGQYDVYPDGEPNPIRVFCDQATDGGGWTVFQRRKDGSENFYREWLDYKNGFGNLDGEFWLGNEYLSILTSNSSHQLRIDKENFEGEKRYAMYDDFQIRPENEKYTLKIGEYSGNVTNDALTYHNGKPFSTKDRDNGASGSSQCAVVYTGAWWYDECYHSNLNGQYVGRKRDEKGIVWWTSDASIRYRSLKFTEMKFR